MFNSWCSGVGSGIGAYEQQLLRNRVTVLEAMVLTPPDAGGVPESELKLRCNQCTSADAGHRWAWRLQEHNSFSDNAAANQAAWQTGEVADTLPIPEQQRATVEKPRFWWQLMADQVKIRKVWNRSWQNSGSLGSRFNKINDRHEETRTPDLYPVNLAFNHLQPFGSVAFPILSTEKNALKGPILVDELLTSFSRPENCLLEQIGAHKILALSSDSA
jgi:hypothetical protein